MSSKEFGRFEPHSGETFRQQESLNPQEILNRKLTTFSIDYAKSVILGDFQNTVRLGGGREVLGSVPGRPDDNKIKLDDAADSLFKLKALGYGLRFMMITEDGKSLVGIDKEEDAEIIAAVDPIDNSGEHEAGLDTPPYSVFTFFEKDKNGKYVPLVGAICDPLRQRFLLYSDGKNKLFQATEETYGNFIRERELKQKPPKKISDPGFVLISYMGSKVYAIPFVENLKGLLEKMDPKGRFHGKGGSHVPLLLATGADAYVMVNDIRTEVSPGYAMAKAAGFGVWVSDEKGNVTDYEFDPNIEDNEPRLPLLIMARNTEIRDEIIKLKSSH